jgi:hypothetical protein
MALHGVASRFADALRFAGTFAVPDVLLVGCVKQGRVRLEAIINDPAS